MNNKKYKGYTIQKKYNQWYCNELGASQKTIKEIKVSIDLDIQKKLKSIRESINNENISYSEIAELQTLIKYIDKSDVELLEWAGIKE